MQQRLGWQATKKAIVQATKRAMATATKRAMGTDGDNTGNAYQYGQWLRQRGWQGFNGGDSGDGAKDMATRARTGGGGMMVVMGHGLCVCFGVCG